MLLSKCAVYEIEKSRIIKEQETSRLLSSLEIKTPLGNILLVDLPLF